LSTLEKRREESGDVPHEYLDLMDKTLNNYVFTLINIQIAIQKIKNIIHFKNLLYV